MNRARAARRLVILPAIDLEVLTVAPVVDRTQADDVFVGEESPPWTTTGETTARSKSRGDSDEKPSPRDGCPDLFDVALVLPSASDAVPRSMATAAIVRGCPGRRRI